MLILNQLQTENQSITMPGRDTFYVGDKKYLKNANYSLCLGEDIYCCAYHERIIMGPINFDDGEAKFTKKAVIIPASAYFEFVDTITKAHESFQNGSEEHWEKAIYKHSKAHSIIGKYEDFNGDAEYGPRLSICIKWFFKLDKSFNRMVEEGTCEPIDTTKITGDHHFLKRGCYMDNDQVSILHSNLPTLLEYSYYETEPQKYVSEFVDYAMSSSKMRDFLKEKLADYQSLTYQSKVKILKHLLKEMFDDKKRENADYAQKIFLDSCTNKVQLIFSLLNFRLKQ